MKVSVVIPTCNRPHLIKQTLDSVLKQSFQDFEIIVVDDGIKERVEKAVKSYNDSRIRYIQHEVNKGGGVARNTGIKNAVGEYIAFLDDDDEWLNEKLEMQVKALDEANEEVGFCFTAVENILDNKTEKSKIPEGLNDYHELSLISFKKFLTVTLVVKKKVFDSVGTFDESLPSHQEAELMIRVTEKYKGIGINVPLVMVNMKSGHDSVGKNFARRIKGEEMLLEKHFDKYKKRRRVLAKHYFQIGLWCRDNGEKKKARGYFFKAWRSDYFKVRYLLHYLYSFLFLHKK